MQLIPIIPNSPDGVHQLDAWWIAVVLPYSIVDALDREKIFNGRTDGYQDVSLDGTKDKATEIDGIYILDGDIVSWNCSSSKGSHVGGLQMQLRFGNHDWLQMLSPGDWCLFWAFDNVTSYEDILSRLRNSYTIKIDSDHEINTNGSTKSPALNEFMSGLKFIGRINSTRRRTSRTGNGGFQVGYNVQAHSFTEFDSVLYYNDVLNFQYPKVSSFFGDFGVDIKELLLKGSRNGDSDGFVNNTKLIPTLANIILGSGPGGRSINQSSGIGDQIKNTPNQKFRIPNVIGKMLGFQRQDTQTVSDILQYHVGQQSHDNAGSDQSPWLKMLPDPGPVEGNVQYTTTQFNDYMLLMPLDLKGKSTWNIMQQWLNEPLNEMFTCMKTNSNNQILPSVVVRRIPLLSDDFAINARTNGISVEPFSSHPAWLISSDLILDEDIGRSDATRFNYFQVIGSDPNFVDPIKTERLSNITTPPAAIEADIARNGLRMYVTRVPAQSYSRVVSAQNNQGRLYTAMMADVLGDMHLKFSGSVLSYYIQAPIAEGENIIHNNMLYHIERVSHSGSISAMGNKIATTTLDMTNGIPTKVLAKRTKSDNEKFGIQDLDARKTIQAEEGGKLVEMRNNRVDLENVGVIGAITTPLK